MVEMTVSKSGRPTHRFPIHNLELRQRDALVVVETSKNWFAAYLPEFGAADITISAPGVRIFGRPAEK